LSSLKRSAARVLAKLWVILWVSFMGCTRTPAQTAFMRTSTGRPTPKEGGSMATLSEDLDAQIEALK